MITNLTSRASKARPASGEIRRAPLKLFARLRGLSNLNIVSNLILAGVFALAFLLAGCAAHHPGLDVFVGTSAPVFITEKPKGNKVALVAGASEGNFTDVLAAVLNANGYKVISNLKIGEGDDSNLNAKADIVIRSNLNYFRINSFKRYDPASVGIMPPLSPLAFAHLREKYMGFGFYEDYRYYEKRFFYMAQIAVMISANGKDYATNLNLETGDSNAPIPSASAIRLFNEAAANKIVEFLKGF